MIARVFPRRTNATPDDEYAFVGDPPLSFCLPERIDEVHVSVTFTWDLPEAERLARAWSRIAPTKIGGPATGMRGEEFVVGLYLKAGYIITSRGCPNDCWFCSVPKREGNEIRELSTPVRGWNILDDNLLACSSTHINRVFSMLSDHNYWKKHLKAHVFYKKHHKAPFDTRIKFTGGLEAARLEDWHVEYLKELRPKEIFFAYDSPQKLDALKRAVDLFEKYDYASRHHLHAYVLVGYPGDTLYKAESRCVTAKDLGFTPMSMVYQDPNNTLEEYYAQKRKWQTFQRSWTRPAAIFARERDMRYLDEVCGNG